MKSVMAHEQCWCDVQLPYLRLDPFHNHVLVASVTPDLTFGCAPSDRALPTFDQYQFTLPHDQQRETAPLIG